MRIIVQVRRRAGSSTGSRARLAAKLQMPRSSSLGRAKRRLLGAVVGVMEGALLMGRYQQWSAKVRGLELTLEASRFDGLVRDTGVLQLRRRGQRWPVLLARFRACPCSCCLVTVGGSCVAVPVRL